MRTLLPTLGMCGVLIAACAPAGAAASTGAIRVPIRQNTGVLGISSLTYHASISLLVPSSWHRTSSSSRSWTTGARSCRYRVRVSTRALSGPGTPGAAERLAAELPQTGARVLDAGVRDSRGSAQGESAWRVTRPVASGISITAARTRRAWSAPGVLPAGQVLWTEIRVTARQLPGTECHSGTYRETLGPQIGDLLATAQQRSYLTQ
ncbi:unannotated protein [freshwater metagenome]|uniref:Unannotated protein n=1 Tax=freshwater metagenome TaxID=449393 RepID=A0A6J7D5W7_9ZZZZ|nr:hypothetical protein [Actinomycetota bacterium]